MGGGCAVRHRHADADVRVVRIGGEGFRAVEDPFVAVAHRGGARARRIRTGFGLGERPAADPFAGGQLRQVLLLLLLRAGFIDVIGTERSMRGDDDSDRTIDTRKFLDDDGILDVAEPRAPVFFREDGAEIAEFSELFYDRERERLVLVPLHYMRGDFRGGEIANLTPKLKLLRSVIKIHDLIMNRRRQATLRPSR